MKENIGVIDRVLRIVIGLALIGLAQAGLIGMWGWIGLLPLIFAGAFKFCPIYELLGISTAKG